MEHSGQFGVIDGVSSLRNWTINEGFTTVKAVHSGSKHGTDRQRGIYDWTGSYSAFGGIPFKMPGEYLTLEAYKVPDATNDLDNGEIFTGSALVLSAAITWNFTTNEAISHVVNFGGNGELTIDNGEQILDASTDALLPPCSGKIAYFVDPRLTTIAHVTQAVLTFTREAKTSVNSGTSAGDGKCLTTRVPGSAIDWTLAITTEDSNEVAALATGSVLELRAFINASQFWGLKWGILGQRSGINVDVEGGNIVGATHNAEMKANLAGVMGSITKPGTGPAWWPFA